MLLREAAQHASAAQLLHQSRRRASRGRHCRLRAAASSAPGGLKWGADGLLPVIVQDIGTGKVLMQAYSDEAGVRETLQTGLATFYSRSRRGRWCKGETSDNYIRVAQVFADCDRDSLVYLGAPDGPACHTNAETCWFTEVRLGENGAGLALAEGAPASPLPVLSALEATILERQQQAAQQGEGKPSWTARLLQDPALLCSKVREEAGELCQTLEAGEGRGRAAQEAADLLYHALVLLRAQDVPLSDVLTVLRSRTGVSGIAEKAARAPK